jgi:hypothetical protein
VRWQGGLAFAVEPERHPAGVTRCAAIVRVLACAGLPVGALVAAIVVPVVVALLAAGLLGAWLLRRRRLQRCQQQQQQQQQRQPEQQPDQEGQLKEDDPRARLSSSTAEPPTGRGLAPSAAAAAAEPYGMQASLLSLCWLGSGAVQQVLSVAAARATADGVLLPACCAAGSLRAACSRLAICSVTAAAASSHPSSQCGFCIEGTACCCGLCVQRSGHPACRAAQQPSSSCWRST